MFITFEGIEGCGKSTQIELLARYLEAKGKTCIRTREPGATLIGSQIRSTLLKRENTSIVPLAELFMYAADRAQHCEEIIRPALSNNQIVLCDRFFDSTTAYQTGGRQIDATLVERINQLATQGLKPHLTFLLDLPVSEGLKRARQRAAQEQDSEDRFEREKLAFHEQVRNEYLKIARQEPERFVLISANQSIAQVQKAILEKIEKVIS